MRGVIKYDYTFMSADNVGRFGFKKSELVKLGKNLKKYNKKLKQEKNNPDLSFRQLPYDRKKVDKIIILSKKLKRKFDNMVVVGIGGSDLGARAIYHTFLGEYANEMPKRGKNLKIYFAGDTTDHGPLRDLLKIINLKKTVFYIVSKSGNTIEPMSVFLFLRKKLIWKVGRKKHKDHFIITTNEDKGALLEIAKKEEYLVLPHYQGGGRYSVLSVNALLPSACAGFDITKLLAGAKAMERLSKSNNYNKNLPFFFAALQYLAYTKRKQNISVLMPYVYNLNKFGCWFRQLWGESISNKINLKNKKVNTGITPVTALGPSDQHSQIQLYNEGPYDKIITFIKLGKTYNGFKVPKYKDSEINYLTGHKFTNILNIEYQATSVSLMKNKRPNGTIIMPELNEYYLGQLFYFFEMAAVYLGELLNVNVFDQPGVEQSKKYMYGLLGKKGYEKDKQEINKI